MILAGSYGEMGVIIEKLRCYIEWGEGSSMGVISVIYFMRAPLTLMVSLVLTYLASFWGFLLSKF